MAGTTISGSYTNSVTLSTPATQNPATISGTGHINVTAASGSALYGSNAAAWSVYNYGTVIAPTRGVYLTAGGTVINESSGLISGGNRGVDITGAAGAVTNAGSIVGSTQQGVRLTGGGSVTNASGGQITGGGTYAAIYIRHGGSVSNAASATIAGAVQIYDSPGTVTNAGSINAGRTSTDGVHLSAGGSVSNTGGGVISGSVGVNLPTGTVSNAGSIIGATEAIQAYGTGTASVTNYAGGLLEGGVAGGTATALSVSNSGAIIGYSFGISLQDFGVISNAAGAIIGATGTPVGGTPLPAGIYLGDGTISNAGSIYGSQHAIAGGGGNVVISNLSSGTIDSINMLKGTSTVTNAGAIIGSVYLKGGAINNQHGGTMSDVNVGGTAGVVINDGSLGRFGIGVVMAHGGTVSNGTDGALTWVRIGVGGGDASLTNSGQITGLVFLYANGGAGNGVVVNQAGATIANEVYIAGIGSHGTVTNAGSIDGIKLNSGGTISNASGGTISGTGTAFAIGGLATVTNYGVISGASGVAADKLTNAGTITGTSGIAASVGTLIVDPGAQFNGTVAGSALYLATGNGGTLAGFGTSIVNFGSITFETGAAWTIAGNTSGLSGVISGFAQADTIDLTGLSETVQDYTAGTLTLIGDKTVTLQLPGPFTKASFRTTPDAGTGTDVFLACFVVGTRIATDRGDVPVEHLRVGDHALTLGDGGALVPRPVRWIGRRRIDLARHPQPEAARPIRIRRGALSEGVPDRDLLLSPDHAIYAEDVLIPVRWLVNERTVVPARRMRQVEYFHVELDQHAILLAEGMPAESYLDTGDRSTFENGGVAVELYPDFASRTWESGGCARLVVTGAEVEAMQQRLQRREEGNGATVSSVLGTGSGHARLRTRRRISRARRSS